MPGAQAVAEAAHGFDQAGGQFLAQATDEDLDGVRVAVAVVRVDVFGQFAARDDLAAPVQQVGRGP
jgi:hypothetical protein